MNTTRYSIHVPKHYNDGNPVAPDALVRIENWILDQTSAFTRIEATGVWRSEVTGRVYSDEQYVYMIDASNPPNTPPGTMSESVHALAADIRYLLDQEAVYVTEQDIRTSLV